MNVGDLKKTLNHREEACNNRTSHGFLRLLHSRQHKKMWLSSVKKELEPNSSLIKRESESYMPLVNFNRLGRSGTAQRTTKNQ